MKGIGYGHSAPIGKISPVSIPGNWITCGVHGDHGDEGRRATTGAIWRHTGDREFS
jgi:hypothetical protein